MRRVVRIVGLLLVMGLLFTGCSIEKEKELTDAEKFKAEYSQVSDENIFVYRTIDEIIAILENGTGVVYLGFPECPWCQAYVKYLDEVAQDLGVEKIYYFNVKEERSNNTEKYLKLVSLLGDNLAYDDEGKHRVYVPDVTVVKAGEIIAHDNETSYDMTAEDTPEAYWTEEKVQQLKKKLENMMMPLIDLSCVSCEG